MDTTSLRLSLSNSVDGIVRCRADDVDLAIKRTAADLRVVQPPAHFGLTFALMPRARISPVWTLKPVAPRWASGRWSGGAEEAGSTLPSSANSLSVLTHA